MADSNEQRSPDSEPSSSQATLRAAVERLYDVFAAYDRLSDFVGCRCGACVSEAENAAIHASPLRQLSPDDLKPVVSSTFVLTTDLKHLLPRIAELVADGHRRFGGHYRAEFLFTTSEQVEGWNQWRTTWPPQEREALEAYFFALWRATLAQDPVEVDAGEVLHIIAQVFDDLAPFLTIWQTELSISSVRHLVALVDENLKRVALYRRLETFWLTRRSRQADQVLAWLTDPATERSYWQEWQEQWWVMRPVRPYREVLPALINGLARFRRCARDTEYFLEVWWGSGSMLALRSLEVFIENHIDGLLATGHLRDRYAPARDPDPWEGRAMDEQKIIAWLLRPETEQMLSERRAAYPFERPSQAVELLRDLRERWRS